MQQSDLKELLRQYFDGTISNYNQAYLFSKLDTSPELMHEFESMKTALDSFQSYYKKRRRTVDQDHLTHILQEKLEDVNQHRIWARIAYKIEQLNNPKTAVRIQWGFAIFMLLFFSFLGYLILSQSTAGITPLAPHLLKESYIADPQYLQKTITIQIQPDIYSIIQQQNTEILEIIPGSDQTTAPDLPFEIDFNDVPQSSTTK
jgi:hypothetical protein